MNKEDGDSLNDRILFFAEKGEISINTLLKTFENGAKVTGSENQELLQEYRNWPDNSIKKTWATSKLILPKPKRTITTNIGFNSSCNGQFIEKEISVCPELASTHGDNVIAPFIALTEVYDANIIFLDTVASKLTDKVKTSKYGKEFLEFIADVKQMNQENNYSNWSTPFAGHR